MRIYNNYSNSFNSDNRISALRGLTNEYGLNLDKRKNAYNEEKIIKLSCNHQKNILKKNK